MLLLFGLLFSARVDAQPTLSTQETAPQYLLRQWEGQKSEFDRLGEEERSSLKEVFIKSFVDEAMLLSQKRKELGLGQKDFSVNADKAQYLGRLFAQKLYSDGKLQPDFLLAFNWRRVSDVKVKVAKDQSRILATVAGDNRRFRLFSLSKDFSNFLSNLKLQDKDTIDLSIGTALIPPEVARFISTPTIIIVQFDEVKKNIQK